MANLFVSISIRSAVDCVCIVFVRFLQDPKSRPASFREIYAALRDCAEAVEELAEKEVVDTRFTHSMMKMKAIRKSARTAFKCCTAISVDANSDRAARGAYEQIEEQLGGLVPTLILMHCTSTHDVERLAQTLHTLAPSSLVCGGTSSSTVMSGTTSYRDSSTSLVLFAIIDPDGHYALAAGAVSSMEEVERSCKAQIASLPADTASEDMVPRLVVSVLAPGTEETVLKGVENALGPVPVFGGSSADNELDSSWRQVSAAPATPVVTTENGFSLLLMWPSVETFVRLTSLHKKTAHAGTVTAVAEGNHRRIMTIDHQPASEVYDRWTAGAIGDELASDNRLANDGGGGLSGEMPRRLVGNVLAASTNFPLGQTHPGDTQMTNRQTHHAAALLAPCTMLAPCLHRLFETLWSLMVYNFLLLSLFQFLGTSPWYTSPV
jgi:hypothetical protein